MSDKETRRLRTDNAGETNMETPKFGGVKFDPSPTCVSGGDAGTAAETSAHLSKTKSSELQISKERNGRIDSVKFWLVVLVVTAHVIMRKEFSGSAACAALWNWVLIFCMPLFVFISGSYSRKKDWRAFWPSIWKLAEPLIIFQVIGLAFYVSDPVSVETVLTPWYMLWYLLSLIYWRLMLQVIPERILRHENLVLATAFCIGILAGFLPFDHLLSVQRTLALMPFFWGGYFLKGKNLHLPGKYKLLCALFLIAIFAVLLFYPHRINDLKYSTPYKNIMGAAIRMIAFGLAVPMSIAFVNVCPHTRWTARQGRMSLQYYIYHAPLIPQNSALTIPLLIMMAEKMNVPMTFVTAIIIAAVTILVIAVALKIPYVKNLTNPSSLHNEK